MRFRAPRISSPCNCWDHLHVLKELAHEPSKEWQRLILVVAMITVVIDACCPLAHRLTSMEGSVDDMRCYDCLSGTRYSVDPHGAVSAMYPVVPLRSPEHPVAGLVLVKSIGGIVG